MSDPKDRQEEKINLEKIFQSLGKQAHETPLGQCPDSEILADFYSGKLEQNETAAVQMHAFRCTQCSFTLVRLDEASKAMDRTDLKESSPKIVHHILRKIIQIYSPPPSEDELAYAADSSSAFEDSAEVYADKSMRMLCKKNAEGELQVTLEEKKTANPIQNALVVLECVSENGEAVEYFSAKSDCAGDVNLGTIDELSKSMQMGEACRLTVYLPQGFER